MATDTANEMNKDRSIYNHINRLTLNYRPFMADKTGRSGGCIFGNVATDMHSTLMIKIDASPDWSGQCRSRIASPFFHTFFIGDERNCESRRDEMSGKCMWIGRIYTYDLVARIRELDAKKWYEAIEDRMSETTVSTYAEKSRSIQRSSLALACFPPSRSATSDNTDNYDKDDYNAYTVTS
uniref:Glycogen(starch) synthase n=1 Tax=Panagrellus redivivus TaxID=6233 RepID=A0A7E4UR21_PANRE